MRQVTCWCLCSADKEPMYGVSSDGRCFPWQVLYEILLLAPVQTLWCRKASVQAFSFHYNHFRPCQKKIGTYNNSTPIFPSFSSFFFNQNSIMKRKLCVIIIATWNEIRCKLAWWCAIVWVFCVCVCHGIMVYMLLRTRGEIIHLLAFGMRERIEVLVPAQRQTGERACWDNRCQDACNYKMVLWQWEKMTTSLFHLLQHNSHN